MDVARVILSANAGYNPNLMSHDTFVSLWRLHTYITSNLAVTVKGNYKNLRDCVCTLLTLARAYQASHTNSMICVLKYHYWVHLDVINITP